MDTGEIEVEASTLQILSTCAPIPFQIDEESDAKEDTRLKYRFLDLRSGGMQKRIKLRHDFIRAIREFLSERDFYEIETPTLIKSTPEGARDFLVPSRIYPGKVLCASPVTSASQADSDGQRLRQVFPDRTMLQG